MALRKDYKQYNGEVVTGYFRVRQVTFSYEKDKGDETSAVAEFIVEVFNENTGERINDESRMEEGIGHYSLPYTSIVTVQSLIDWAYEHLKGLELFAGAEDV